MCPIFLPLVRLPIGTIEDRVSVYDCSHARGGSLKSNGLARTQLAPGRRKGTLTFYSKESLGAVMRVFITFADFSGPSGKLL
jgi:hypothetical protein